MKRFFLIILLFGFTKLNAQIHEVGVFLGGSNYIGDIGNTAYVNPNELAYGLLYKWNKSPRHSWRISYTQAKITGNDLDYEVSGRFKRGYDFENNIKELSLGLEFNFFDFNLHDFERKVTPYVYSGLSYTNYNELYTINGVSKEDKNSSVLAIPIVLGVKSNVLPNLILGLEVGARYTMTDNLDGSFPKNEKLESLKFGNINSKDWYVFSGFTLTYTFGEKPCYCAD
ncbi:DUF6089 family protein [Flavobacterium sp.]|uniref:type IX secretion system protein PorG n=1 Tax=Flavobacterium sp. TaxID=239 RepID=UPI0026095E06|nr:DUF6089 family protein [Flavobacterium sp.]